MTLVTFLLRFFTSAFHANFSSTLQTQTKGKKMLHRITILVVATIIYLPISAEAGALSNVIKSLTKTAEKAIGRKPSNIDESAAAAAIKLTSNRASKAAGILKEVTIGTAILVASEEVVAQMEKSDHGSALPATVAYYIVLSKKDPEAAMGLWLNPNPIHFRHLHAIEYFKVTNIQELSRLENTSEVLVNVLGKVNGRPEESYSLLFTWVHTDDGWRIQQQQSAIARQ